MENIPAMFSEKFDVFGFGRCKLQVIEESEQNRYPTGIPTAYVVNNNNEIICALNLLYPKYTSRRNLTDRQKRDIDNRINTIAVERFTGIRTDPWQTICIYWTDLNGGYDELVFPEVPPDYFGFRSNTSPK